LIFAFFIELGTACAVIRLALPNEVQVGFHPPCNEVDAVRQIKEENVCAVFKSLIFRAVEIRSYFGILLIAPQVYLIMKYLINHFT